jgi:hypothetical protein
MKKLSILGGLADIPAGRLEKLCELSKLLGELHKRRKSSSGL